MCSSLPTIDYCVPQDKEQAKSLLAEFHQLSPLNQNNSNIVEENQDPIFGIPIANVSFVQMSAEVQFEGVLSCCQLKWALLPVEALFSLRMRAVPETMAAFKWTKELNELWAKQRSEDPELGRSAFSSRTGLYRFFPGALRCVAGPLLLPLARAELEFLLVLGVPL